MSVSVEVCVCDIGQALVADELRVDSLEICSALELGGLTPSVGMVMEIQKQTSSRLRVLIRPRGGNFVYGQAEKRIMYEDIARFVDLGISGFVVGALSEKGVPDTEFIGSCVDRSAGVELTFHRAIDLVADPVEHLHDLAAIGVKRILTSGGKESAYDGAQKLNEMQKVGSKLGLSIAAAAGISDQNVLELIATSGVGEVHFSARLSSAAKGTFAQRIAGLDHRADRSKIEKILAMLHSTETK